MKKGRRIKRVKISLIIFLLIISCKRSEEKIFWEIKPNLFQTNFKKENYKIKINTENSLDAYSFNFNNKKRIYGYIGIIKDTIFFVNPLFNENKCIVKFPILILNNAQKDFIVEPSSNCYDIPVFNRYYKIEILDITNDIYTVKHSIYETTNSKEKFNKDFCIFKLSLKYGIIEFKYSSFQGEERVPWCFPNSKSMLNN